MAVSQIYLQGGPCNGRTVSANDIQGGLVGYIKCGGGYYTDSGNMRPNGDEIFSYSGNTAPSPPDTAGAARAHGGWADVRKSVNRRMPAALKASKRNTAAALRSLSRARKVHH